MKILEIHNSDRVTFRRCRTKWDYQSGLRKNLVLATEAKGPLWLGSGFHFALEDFHGYNRFGDPRRAFDAYVEATSSRLPPDAEELIKVAEGMLAYYVELWLPKRPVNQTLWVNGQPQVEVDIEIDITPWLPVWLIGKLREFHEDDEVLVVVKQTFDKVEVDEYDRIWGVDYKTAKQMADPGTLQMNPQKNQYSWAMAEFYDKQVEGIIWQQHLKKIPKPPKHLATGGLSQQKGQATTYSMYRQELLDMFGRIPKGYADILNELAAEEDDRGDKFIRRDPLRVNLEQRRAEFEHLIKETTEMLDPEIPIYPNPTRDCVWDCPYKDVRLADEAGEDFEYLLATEFVTFQGYDDSFRERIQWPEASVV